MNINVYIKFCLWLAPVSRQEEANPLFWLAWPVGNIGLSCLLAITHFLLQERFCLDHIINRFLTKLVRVNMAPYWLCSI